MKFLTLAAFLVVFTLSGCATSRRKFDTKAASNIQKGVTTKAQVQQAVGIPHNIGKDDEGNEIWTYATAPSPSRGASSIKIGELAKGRPQIQEEWLVVKFSPAGVVTSTNLFFGGMSRDDRATEGQVPTPAGVAK